MAYNVMSNIENAFGDVLRQWLTSNNNRLCFINMSKYFGELYVSIC